ncbi:transglutaminase family protein [Pseudooceanicola sp. 216_PA32_1]|uniref:Transglutaminase family protein n=1 Tax=Pseudooceanicola pacificus TaxID=2676438 RepID=A0A844WEQ8_9RHOB|nr:transglutaminase family protein [Pseudooceanicola pacificus]MWB78560.1 transglutaminase family protein [Pseudooceanicola pacificus]
MLYDVELTIEHGYATPAEGARTHVHLMPLTVPGRQSLITGMISATPLPDERLDRTDFFGNPVTEFAWRKPLDDLVLHLQARVQSFAAPSTLDLAPDLPGLARELNGVTDLGPQSPHHFRAASPRVAPAPEMTQFARDLLWPGITALQAVITLGRALYGEMTFDAKATDVNTPPAEAFRHRHGVCQDFTHVMIACLRGIGIPAGYVSGFLRTIPPPGKERLAGADAMHAWVRAWVGIETGWVEFDPTNDLLVGTDHIVVAHGRDYSDLSPDRGVLRTFGAQESSQAVDVIPVPVAG